MKGVCVIVLAALTMITPTLAIASEAGEGFDYYQTVAYNPADEGGGYYETVEWMEEADSLMPAAAYPYDIVSENYVPSLYFSVAPTTDLHLVATADFPYETCDLCYTPSLYYEAWQVAAVEGMK